jgi:transaldolase
MSHPSLDALTARSERHATPQTEPTNSVRALQTFGQSVWLDYLRRSLFTSGEFQRLITEDGLRGVTSNPSIFERAIAGSTDYLRALQDMERRGDMEPMALYEALAICDIRDAADLLRPRTSLEDNVDAAHATIAALERVGISLSDVTDRLLEDGVTLFREAFDSLLAAVDKGRRSEIVGLS